MNPAPGPATTNLLDRPGEEIARSFVSAGAGLQLGFAESGKGPPVVLLHGTLTALDDMMIGLAGHLENRRRVIAFDRPGFGRSTVRRLRDAGIWRQAEGLLQACDQLGLESPLLVGHSFGASVALAMAMMRPGRVGGVVALAPLVRPEPRLEHVLFGPRASVVGGDWLGWASGLTTDRALLPSLWRAMYLPQVMPEIVERTFPFALAGRSASSIRVGEDAVAALPDLARLVAEAPTCPTPVRILGGDRDAVVHNGSNGRMLAAIMPNAEFIDLPGMGHMAHHFAGERIAAVVGDLSNLVAPADRSGSGPGS